MTEKETDTEEEHKERKLGSGLIIRGEVTTSQGNEVLNYAFDRCFLISYHSKVS